MSNKLGLSDNERIYTFDEHIEAIINKHVLKKLKSYLRMYNDGLLTYEVLLVLLDHELDRYEE